MEVRGTETAQREKRKAKNEQRKREIWVKVCVRAREGVKFKSYQVR